MNTTAGSPANQDMRTRAMAAVEQLRGLLRLEWFLSGFCILMPMMMLIADEGWPVVDWSLLSWPVRPSISAYYDMVQNQWFYFPMTVAAMLFIVNGAVKRQHWYNLALGLAVCGIVLFNLKDARLLHFVSAVAFFAGNVVVMAFCSQGRSWWFKATFIAGIVASMVAWQLGWLSLFWAEWVSLSIIAVHYILASSAGFSAYQAIPPRTRAVVAEESPTVQLPDSVDVDADDFLQVEL